MSGLSAWHTTAAANASVGTINWAEGQSPATVNDSARQTMADLRTWYEMAEWRDWGHTPTYSSATAFTISDAASLSSIYSINRRIKTIDAGGTAYGTIVDTTWVASTQTVHITFDSGSLTNPMTSIALGPDITNQPINAAGIKNAARTDIANTFTGVQTFSTTVAIANAVTLSNILAESNTSVTATTATSNIWVANYVTLSGATAFTITNFANAPQAGVEVELYCNTAYTFANNSNLIIDGANNFTATQGDRVFVRANSTTIFSLHPIKKNGTSVIGRSFVLLGTKTASVSATLSFTTSDFDWTLYDSIEFHLNGLIPSSSAQHLQARISQAGSFKSDASYDNLRFGVDGAGTTLGSASTGQTHLQLTHTGTDGSQSTGGVNTRYSGKITIVNPQSTAMLKNITLERGIYQNNVPTVQFYISAMRYTANSSAIDGIQFGYALGGAITITSGSITAYGINN